MSLSKSINILGVTGSIGQSTADVIASDPGRFKVINITAYENAALLAETARRLKAEKAVIGRVEKKQELEALLEGSGIEAEAGEEALLKAAGDSVDLTVAAIIGLAGLEPLVCAIQNSAAIAVANKEPLVAAGPLVISLARENGTQLLPLDSEHNAIFQVFDFERRDGIEKIILTASGGPFRAWSSEDMDRATPNQALAHPTWSMGKKISIDSATMMNKALEIIEAHYLFDMPPEKIEVLVHPQSIIHSMVEYRDGSVLAQLGANDMRTPIAYALAWPERMKTPGERLDFLKLGGLHFEAPDTKRFPAIDLAYHCLQKGQHACIALNAANEVAVEAFLTNSIGFTDIMDFVSRAVDKAEKQSFSGLDDIKNYDMTVRRLTNNYISTYRNQEMVTAS